MSKVTFLGKIRDKKASQRCRELADILRWFDLPLRVYAALTG